MNGIVRLPGKIAHTELFQAYGNVDWPESESPSDLRV